MAQYEFNIIFESRHQGIPEMAVIIKHVSDISARKAAYKLLESCGENMSNFKPGKVMSEKLVS